jgi:hypothetical protein
MKSFHSLLIAGALAAASLAQAHGLWIAPTRDGVSIHYGEYAHNLKEKKDKLTPYAGSLVAKDAQGQTLKPVLREDGFYAAARGAVTASIEQGPIYGEGNEAVRYSSYLRYAPAWGRAAEPSASFPVDIVPVAGSKPAFRIYKEGKAAGGAWVEVTAPNGWSKWFESDSTGRVVIQAPWSGLYVLHAEHENATAGTQDGKPYAKTHQSATLSIRKP